MTQARGSRMIFEVPYGRDPADPGVRQREFPGDSTVFMRDARRAGVLAVPRQVAGADLDTADELIIDQVITDMSREVAARKATPEVIIVPDIAAFIGGQLVGVGA